MGTKVITKRIHDKLDSFIFQKKENIVIQEPNIPQNKKTLRKNDGLIERVDIGEKMFITEDNRQLLND